VSVTLLCLQCKGCAAVSGLCAFCHVFLSLCLQCKGCAAVSGLCFCSASCHVSPLSLLLTLHNGQKETIGMWHIVGIVVSMGGGFVAKISCSLAQPYSPVFFVQCPSNCSFLLLRLAALPPPFPFLRWPSSPAHMFSSKC